MKHGGEEAATHGDAAPSHVPEWLAFLSAEQKAFAATMLKGRKSRRDEGVKEAVEAGASVETAVYEHGATACHWAARNGHSKIMEWPARKGAGHSARNKSGCTPIHQAALGGQEPRMLILSTQAQPQDKMDMQDKANGEGGSLATAFSKTHPPSRSWRRFTELDCFSKLD
jgi:ankyrin repeat protein